MATQLQMSTDTVRNVPVMDHRTIQEGQYNSGMRMGKGKKQLEMLDEAAREGVGRGLPFPR